MKIIGIVGGKGNGKTTVCKMMRESLEARGLRVEVVTLAEPVKRGCEIAYPELLPEQLYGTQEQKERIYPNGLSGRKCMQRFSDAVKALTNSMFFVKCLFDKLTWRTEADVAIIEDVRYRDEALMLQVYEDRLKLVRVWAAPGMPAYIDEHGSEVEWPTIEVNVEVKPDRMDLTLLKELVDDAICDVTVVKESDDDSDV